MNGTRQRFKQGVALILNQCRQVTGTDRQQPSLEDDQDRENTASLTVKPNLTQQFVSTGTPKRHSARTDYDGLSTGPSECSRPYVCTTTMINRQTAIQVIVSA